MCACMFAFTFNDALMKVSFGSIPIFQSIFVRGLFCLGLIILFACTQDNVFKKLSRRDSTIIGFRSGFEAIAAMTFLFAIQKMPLANALSILQSVPLAVCMAGAIFLSERVGWRRWIAIVLGFGGVLVIIDPSSSDFNLYTFLVLITVIFASARDVLTRSLSADVPSLLVAILTAIPTCAVAGFLTLFLGWKEAPTSDYVILIEASLLISFGYLFSVMAMRQGEISFVSPFRFTAMIWAIGFGFLFFGELPNLQTYFGTLLVISTGIYTFRREYLKNKISLGNYES